MVHIKLEDHNPPTFEQIILFCDEVKKWLDQHEDNYAVVHCKAGKVFKFNKIFKYILNINL